MMVNTNPEIISACSTQSILKIESTKIEPVESIDKVEKVTCSVCDITLSSKRTLKRHMMTKHVPKPDSAPSEKPFKCDQCTRQFGKMKNLTYHKKKEHKVMPEIQQRCKPCPICRYICNTRERADMDLHLHLEHGVDITPKETSFESFQEFLDWKEHFETETKSKYVVSGKGKDGTIRYYACHRSGFYDTKGKGVRKLKSQGSKKINSYCPAYMKAVIDLEGLVNVKYLESHVGHDNDLVHLTLTSKEKESLATMLSSKVPLDYILEGVKGSVGNENRMHLLKKKDLYNISKDLKKSVKSEKREVRSSKELTPEAWLAEMKRPENSCILHYKRHGEISDDPLVLGPEDEFLVVMGPEGLKMLKMFGQNCVCLDKMTSSNTGHYLVTLMAQDDSRQGLPAAVCISSRFDHVIAVMFLEILRATVGILGPSVLLCDPGDVLYSAWCSVMAPPVFRLFSRWHVLADWQENLAKIESELKRTSTYNTLAGLLEERDSGIFYATLTVVTDLLACDDGTSEFASYLVERYKNSAKSWATCHRTRSMADAAVHMERVHMSIEHLFSTLPLWPAIMAVVKFINERVCDRNAHDKRSNLLAAIRSRHRQAENMVTACVAKQDGGWEVTAGGDIFIVERTLDSCPCQLLCPECSACPHMYTCRCEDSFLRWNMCRHIHLVCSCIVASKPPDPGTSMFIDANIDGNIMIEVLEDVHPSRGRIVHALEGLVHHVKTCPAEQLVTLENLVDQVVAAVNEIKTTFPSVSSSEMQSVTQDNLIETSLPILN